ncbi:hypothetical protein ABES02_29760 [Neobacillus pocheonensis]|uniref:hypothetical protein n=1 Tax=Neobacillus pocheonensis TaxID=363869 RepID=UPI003D2B5E51
MPSRKTNLPSAIGAKRGSRNVSVAIADLPCAGAALGVNNALTAIQGISKT